MFYCLRLSTKGAVVMKSIAGSCEKEGLSKRLFLPEEQYVLLKVAT